MNPAQAPRRAFGSRLVERSFAAEVGVEVKLTCARTGLTCRLEASQASIREANEKSGGLTATVEPAPGHQTIPAYVPSWLSERGETLGIGSTFPRRRA